MYTHTHTHTQTHTQKNFQRAVGLYVASKQLFNVHSSFHEQLLSLSACESWQLVGHNACCSAEIQHLGYLATKTNLPLTAYGTSLSPLCLFSLKMYGPALFSVCSCHFPKRAWNRFNSAAASPVILGKLGLGMSMLPNDSISAHFTHNDSPLQRTIQYTQSDQCQHPHAL